MIELKEFVDPQKIKGLFNTLNDEKIQYALIKNTGHTMPDRHKDGKDIDLLVKLDDMEKFADCMKKNGWLYRCHSFGKDAGWTFAYNLPECQVYELGNTTEHIYVDACFKLMCKSLMPKFWVPLNEPMQQKAWSEREWNNELGCWQLGPKTLFVYFFVREVFDKHEFKAEYIQEIEKKKGLLDDNEVYELLKTVFFGFTNELIELEKKSDYKSIIKKYITYKNY